MAALLILLSTMIATVNCLIGFDCTHGKLNVTTINLLEPVTCNVPEVQPQEEKVYAQLLQLTEFRTTDAIQCRIEIDRTVYHCGMHSHVSLVELGRQKYIKFTSKETCHRLYREGSIEIWPGKFLNNIPQNATTRRSVTLSGGLATDGSCQPGFFDDQYGQWTSVVVQAIVKISVTKQKATIKLNNDKIVFQTGLTCDFSTASCSDEEGGNLYWEVVPEDNCKFTSYDVLHEGYITRVQASEQEPVVYSITSQDITFALIKTTEVRICGYSLFKTEHPKLFIFETSQGNTFKTKGTLPIESIDIFTYVNSKFIYVEKHIRQQMTELYKDVILQKCELEKQVLKNSLTLATILPDEFAYNVMGGPGHMATIAGEVAHIVKCIPVSCAVRETQDCYTELPVTIRNTSYFLIPKSKILVKKGTQVECNRILAPMYRIDDVWYRFTPHHEEVLPPKALQHQTQYTWKFIDTETLAISGIYGQKDIDRFRDHLLFPAERPAILNNLARGMTGKETRADGSSIYNLFNEQIFEQIADSTYRKVWGGFITFGSATAGIMGILIVIRIIKLVVDTIIHGYTLHQVYGWSLKLLGSLWTSVTHLLVYMGHQSTQAQDKKDVEKDERLQPAISLPSAAPPEEEEHLYPQLVQLRNNMESGITNGVRYSNIRGEV
ncbi:uncharacterized protein LOC105693533 [Athalia rosae]|uniref:uncharacterized protein LOC105693533 n=1 Tax=Athalia rosae TaxID=37344 RepID=UPI0020347520|nr:uncharacterized protein LOC105693533 [Athalia rosae]